LSSIIIIIIIIIITIIIIIVIITEKWYDHQPLPIVQNGEERVTWDMTIYTDKVLKRNRPDITLVHKDTQKWTLIDIAVPADQNIIRTEEEKVEKYKI